VAPIVTFATRFHFDTASSAAAGLLAVILDARVTDRAYKFSGLSAQQILMSGLRLEGEIAEVVQKLEAVPGAVRYDE